MKRKIPKGKMISITLGNRIVHFNPDVEMELVIVKDKDGNDVGRIQEKVTKKQIMKKRTKRGKFSL